MFNLKIIVFLTSTNFILSVHPMKILICFFTFFIFISCDTSKEVKKNKAKTSTDTVINEKITKKTVLSDEEKTLIEKKIKKKVDILLPGQYRDWDNNNPVNSLTKDWIDLHQKNGKYYLDKVDYTISRGFSECSGDSTKIVESRKNTMLFINKSNLKLGEINSLKFKKSKIWPKEKISFIFKNIEYILRAEGDIISSEDMHADKEEEVYHNVENYKLYISSNNSHETIFLEEASFNDTFVKLLFVGDIDNDNKLDFIFSANRHYEEERVILYLSSKAKKGGIIKRVAEVSIGSDC